MVLVLAVMSLKLPPLLKSLLMDTLLFTFLLRIPPRTLTRFGHGYPRFMQLQLEACGLETSVKQPLVVV